MKIQQDAPAHIAIAVSNLEKSKEFYCELLGFEVAKEVTVPEEKAKIGGFAKNGFSFTTITSGPFALKLIEMKGTPPSCGGLVDEFFGLRYLGFKIDSFHETIERLRASGVQFLSDPLLPGPGDPAPPLIFFKDPDGNLLELGG